MNGRFISRIIFWFWFSSLSGAFPEFQEGPSEARIYQPLSLKAQCYKPLEAFCMRYIQENGEQEFLQNIRSWLPVELIESFAYRCLDGKLKRIELPNEFGDNLQVTRNHRYIYKAGNIYAFDGLIHYEFFQINIWDIKKNKRALSSETSAMSLLSNVVVSPSGKYYAYLENAIGGGILNIHQINTLSSESLMKQYIRLKGLVYFHDDNTIVAGVGHNILIYQIDQKKETEIELDYEIAKLILFNWRLLVYNSSFNDEYFANIVDLHAPQSDEVEALNPSIMVSATNNSDVLATSAHDGAIQVWHIKNDPCKFECGNIIQNDNAIADCIAFDPTATFLIKASTGRQSEILDKVTGEVVHIVPCSSNLESNFISWASDNKQIMFNERRREQHSGRRFYSNTVNFHCYAPHNLWLGLLLKKSLAGKNLKQDGIQEDEAEKFVDLNEF